MYIIKTNGRITYRSSVSFEQIFSLYMLDKNLRNAVMASMQDLEEHIKELSADVIANTFGIHQEEYLQFRNYQNKKKRKPRFSLANILDTMRKALNTDKEPIHHYAVKYGAVPPWILFKSIYFSTIINFIDLFKQTEKENLIRRLYDIENFDLPISSLNMLMMDTLFVCLDYRNMAAHGGRIYNYNSNSRLRMEEIFGNTSTTYIIGFGKLLFLLSLFRYQNPYERLNSVLKDEINRHCSAFPQDVTYLGQILNLDIHETEVVYVSNNSQKYHKNPHCSGIVDSVEIPLEEAKSMEYEPCKRCNK